MTSKGRKEFDEWMTRSYDTLLSHAAKMHADAGDLVSHVYLRVVAQGDHVLENPMAYFRKAMWIEATRGQFKKQYAVMPEVLVEPAAEDNSMTESIRREQLQVFMDRLSWFDRQVFMLYLEGANISRIARESGIARNTLHMSLHRTKKKIRDAFSYVESKKREARDL